MIAITNYVIEMFKKAYNKRHLFEINYIFYFVVYESCSMQPSNTYLLTETCNMLIVWNLFSFLVIKNFHVNLSSSNIDIRQKIVWVSISLQLLQ